MPPGEVIALELGPVMDRARAHLDGLKRMLLAYANPSQPYLPRAMMFKDEEAGDFDHLSRYREWALSGEAP
jgi:hypothetical protein